MSTPIWECFGIPEAAAAYTDCFLTQADQRLIEAMQGQSFTAEDVAAVLGEDTARELPAAYRRGVLDLENETEGRYRVGSFYGMLDLFAITRAEDYRALPEAVRRELDTWYFSEYCAGLDASAQPTADAVLPLDEVLAFIDAQTRQIYLNYCDCRSLRGDCDLPTKTCITYKSAPNTFAHRGISEPISKEQAKEVVREAERAGLMHTVNPNGICSCCGDCCYLFRAQRERGSRGVWPRSGYVAALDERRCIGCGLCARRCHLGALTREGRSIHLHPERCVGCGICATACPGGALRIEAKTQSEEAVP